MAVLVDTDVLIDLERGNDTARIEEQLGNDDRAISVITVSELLHGVRRATGATRTKRHAFVEHLLGELRALAITDPVARVHAEIWADLTARGEPIGSQPIGSHDLWIAATAIAHGLQLATGNTRHFARVPGLQLLATPN